MIMDASEILTYLLAQPAENEILEFKEAKNSFSSEDMKKYFSALCNEANLNGKTEAWLVFGVNDARQVVGTRYRENPAHLASLKHDLSVNLTNNISFKNIHCVDHPLGRVLLFEIPAAPRGIPIGVNGFYYARQGSSLKALDIEKID